MSTFRMTRIELPEWARRPQVSNDRIQSGLFQAIQLRRAEMLEHSHREIEAYLNLNTPVLQAEGDEASFPNPLQMSGEYYVSDEYYIEHENPRWVQISIKCHCLRKTSCSVSDDRDYLGLEVWLKYDPFDCTYEVYRNTDASVI